MEGERAPRVVRVRARGQLTIPQEMRQALGLEAESNLSITRVGRALVLTPTPSKRAQLARQFARAMREEEVSLNDLLEELRHRREGAGSGRN